MRFGAALMVPIGFGARPFGEGVAVCGLVLTDRVSRRFASDPRRPSRYKRTSSLAVLSTLLLFDPRAVSSSPSTVPEEESVTRPQPGSCDGCALLVVAEAAPESPSHLVTRDDRTALVSQNPRTRKLDTSAWSHLCLRWISLATLAAKPLGQRRPRAQEPSYASPPFSRSRILDV